MEIKNNKIEDPTLHICVPTYKENKYVLNFLSCLNKSTYKNWKLYIVNAYPKDKLEEKVSSSYRDLLKKICIINGSEDEYWSATVNRGLRIIKNKNNPNDKLIIANVDSSFSKDLLQNLIKNHQKNTQLGCVSINKNKKIIKSGIIVKSWLFALNNHLMINQNHKDIKKKLIAVDFLPISFVLFPVEIINKSIFIDSNKLPHYGGDYAFSLFLKSKGYKPYIDFSSPVENSEENTGYCIYRKKIKLFNRLKNLLSIKNPSSLKHRFWLVVKYYPLYARPTAIISYFSRSLIEALLGGEKIMKLKNFLKN